MAKKTQTSKLLLLGLLIIAGIADIKYQGMVYRMLPQSIQKSLDTWFRKQHVS